jgi:hypothetical protein
MSRISRSIALVRSSWQVLSHDRELIALPAISGLATAVCVAPFFAGAFLVGVSTSGQDTQLSPIGLVLAFLGYLVAAYVTIFFQSALILAANERFSGGNPTLGSAIRAAAGRAGAILPWAIISATVSMILRSLQERSGLLGRIVLGLVGMAWALVTFLVLPILVIEGTGVKDALTRSASTFKMTWGENVVGNAGIGLVGVAGVLIGLLVAGPIIAIGISGDLIAVTVAGIVVLVLWLIVVSVISSALSGVFQTALYRFAVLGDEPSGFSHEQIAGAFVAKSGRFG